MYLTWHEFSLFVSSITWLLLKMYRKLYIEHINVLIIFKVPPTLLQPPHLINIFDKSHDHSMLCLVINIFYQHIYQHFAFNKSIVHCFNLVATPTCKLSLSWYQNLCLKTINPNLITSEWCHRNSSASAVSECENVGRIWVENLGRVGPGKTR